MAEVYGSGRETIRQRIPCGKLSDRQLPKGIRRMEEDEIDEVRSWFAGNDTAVVQPGAVGFFFNQRDWFSFVGIAGFFICMVAFHIANTFDPYPPHLIRDSPFFFGIAMFASYAVMLYFMIRYLRQRLWLVIDDSHLFFRKRGALSDGYKGIPIDSISRIEFGRSFGLGNKMPYRVIIIVDGNSYTAIRYKHFMPQIIPRFLAEVASDSTGLPLILKRVN